MYLNFYGLKEEPFRLTPDPKFLHLAEAHRNVLGGLLTGVVARKGFIVITGPVGTGKTTLLHASLYVLTRRLTGDRKLATALLVNPTFTRDDFLEAVLDEFEIPCAGSTKPKRLAALHEALLQTHWRGGTSVLIVDEAHLLSPDVLEEIRLLSNLDTHQHKLLQIVLTGQPELTELLNHPQLKALQQRITLRLKLRELTCEETRAYIAERLHAGGLRAASPFSREAIDAIFEYAGGVPRLINQLCDKCLTIGSESQSKQVGRDIAAVAAEELLLVSPAEAVPQATLAARMTVERGAEATPLAKKPAYRF